MSEIWSLLRKFSSNMFKAENEEIIYQILDLRLADCCLKYIKACQGEGKMMRELMSMIALFMVDE